MRLTKFAAHDSLGVGKATLKLGASLLVLSAATLASPAFAQDNEDDADEATASADEGAPAVDENGNVILVTGFRASLRSAQAIKENADTIVDSVTAEDIGALPDRSVTETLQRIPGISINRFSAGVDPDHFSAEGAGVVVRGLTYVRSEFNGREAFTANNGRALGFADVPSELLGRVDVLKSPSADRIEGGIAGTVDLHTRLPLDNRGLSIAGSIEANYSEFIDKWSPTGAIVISDSWETGIGEIGLLASYSYSELFTRADRFQVSSFRVRPIYSNGTRTDVVPFTGATQMGEGLFPRGAVEGTQEFDRDRYGYSAAAQWRSNDGRAEATFQFLRSDSREAWTEHTVEIATDNVAGNGDSRAVAGTSLEFDDSGLFDNGFITGPTGWRDDRQTDALRTPILGLQSNNIRRDKKQSVLTSDYSANLKYEITDNLAVNFDYQHVDSKVDVWDNGLWVSTYQDAFIDLNGSDFPTVAFLPPQNCTVNPCPGTPGSNGGSPFGNDDDDYPAYFTGAHNSFSDPFNSFYRSEMDHRELSDGNLDAVRLDLDYSFPDDSFLDSIRVGGRYGDRDQTARFSTYNWGVLSEQWGNRGPVWLDDPVNGSPSTPGGAPLMGYEEFCFDDFFGGSVDNPMNGQCRLFYSGNTVEDYAGYVQYGNQINREWQPTTTAPDGRVINGGWNSLYDRTNAIPGTPFSRGEINPQEEKNKAAYVMLRFGDEFDNGWNFSGNIGVRYTTTDRTSSGYQEFAVATALPNDETCRNAINNVLAGGGGASVPAVCALTPAERTAFVNFANGAVVANDAQVTYDYWLPSVNLKLEVGDGLQFRAAYSKGIAPPDLGLIRNYFPVAVTPQALTDASGTPIPIVVTPTAPGTGAFGSDGNVAPGQVRVTGAFNAGNPDLLPIEADNFDLTAEWYFSNVGQLTGALFYKRLKGVLTNDVIRRSFTNNGATYDAVVTTPVNSDEVGKIKGFEIAYQQVFDFLPGFLSGLGLQANYTYVDSSGVPQSTLSATDPDVAAGRVSTIPGEGFPLQGLSKHQVNITPFIDIGPVSARASYSWRSRFLLTLRDVITPFDPIFQEPYGQLDASITVAVTDNIKLGVQGYNLLNSVTKTSAAVLDQNDDVRLVPRGWYIQDRRFSFVARFNF